MRPSTNCPPPLLRRSGGEGFKPLKLNVMGQRSQVCWDPPHFVEGGFSLPPPLSRIGAVKGLGEGPRGPAIT